MEEIKNILLSLGYNLLDDGASYWRTNAVFRQGGNRTSLRISKKHGGWSDFVTHKSGNLARLVQLTLNLDQLKDAKQWLQKKQYLSPDFSKPESPSRIIMADTWEPAILNKLVRDHRYWNQRGIKNEILEPFEGGVATEGRMVDRYIFPIFDLREEKIIGFAGRDITNKKLSKWKLIGTKLHWMFPLHLNRQEIIDKQEVILVESVGDLLSLWQAGFKHSLCLFGTYLNDKMISSLVGLNLKKIYIAINNDSNANSNQKACEMYIRLIKFFDKPKVQIKLPLRKDFGEMNEQEIERWHSSINVAVVGSREFNDYDLLQSKLEPYKAETGMIVSGGALGADTLGKQWANDHNVPCIEFFPEWNKFGKAAGFIRNEYIIANADKAIAFWRKGSRGTENDIEIAKRTNKPIEIIDYKSLEKIQI